MESKRILYLSYWGIADVLTASSVFPSLRAFSNMENVSGIIFCSIERDKVPALSSIPLPDKVRHVPLKSLKGLGLGSKFYDFIVFPQVIKKQIDKYNINTIICRSSLAGGMLVDIARRRSIPIIVESFEPHSDYMVESGVWTKDNVRTRLARDMEDRLKSEAAFLLPVSENYKKKLIIEGVNPSRIRVMPCTVRLNQFELKVDVRNKLRTGWSWTGLTVGIYIGKFGGIYYEAEAFEQFREAFRYFGDRFALIILTAQADASALAGKYLLNSVDPNRVRILSVPHERVGDYLATADFAFSTIKPAPSRRFCSPIKHGEYWANGLPIILEEGIGDDSEIIAKENGGVILRKPEYREAFEKIDSMIRKGRTEIYRHIHGLAVKYRNEKIVDTTYRDIFGV